MKVWVETHGEKYHTDQQCAGDVTETDLVVALDKGYAYCSICRRNAGIETEKNLFKPAKRKL